MDRPEAESTRAARETQFHDERFAADGGTRKSTKFYRLTRTSRAAFAERIDSIPQGDRVLEIGCGPDSAAWELLGRGVDVTGIDISSAAIRLAHGRAQELSVDPERFRTMNAERLEFADDSFDAVVGASILHHLDLPVALAELRRVLRPGGRGIFYEPLGYNPAINLYRRLTPSERSEDEKALTSSELTLVRQAFPSLDLEHFHLVSLAALPLLSTRAFDPVASALERVDRMLFSVAPPLRRLAWVLVLDGTTEGRQSS